jgi:hypothetical protein
LRISRGLADQERPRYPPRSLAGAARLSGCPRFNPAGSGGGGGARCRRAPRRRVPDVLRPDRRPQRPDVVGRSCGPFRAAWHAGGRPAPHVRGPPGMPAQPRGPTLTDPAIRRTVPARSWTPPDATTGGPPAPSAKHSAGAGGSDVALRRFQLRSVSEHRIRLVRRRGMVTGAAGPAGGATPVRCSGAGALRFVRGPIRRRSRLSRVHRLRGGRPDSGQRHGPLLAVQTCR